MHAWTPLYLASVLALGVFAQWLAWRTRLPAIVLLLIFGFALGLGIGKPEDFLGDEALLPAVSLAVGVILFEGGLSLSFKELKETGAVVFRLVTVGLLFTWAAALLAAHWLLGFSWPMATLLGALLTDLQWFCLCCASFVPQDESVRLSSGKELLTTQLEQY